MGYETSSLVAVVYGGSDAGPVVRVAARADPNAYSLATNGDFVARQGVGNDIEKVVNQPRPSPGASHPGGAVSDILPAPSLPLRPTAPR